VRADLVPPDEFDEIVQQALDRLPDEAIELIQNVAVLVREEPLPSERVPGRRLFGLYRGVPRTRSGDRVPGSLPDTITLYRRAILSDCATVEEVPDRVMKVLGHEVGHAFGLSEAQLRAYGWY
jgi:predicted Zn-dependent protease with MMP-like domain